MNTGAISVAAAQLADKNIVNVGFCGPNSICLELVKGIPTALVALIIGLVAASIAYQQFRVAKAKLNLDLFDRRYAIFEKTWGMLSSVVGKGPGPLFFAPFSNIVPVSSFLFGEEIKKYLETISSNRTALSLIEMRTKANNDIMRPSDIDEHLRLSLWFVTEANTGVKEKFGEFLDFKEWR